MQQPNNAAVMIGWRAVAGSWTPEAYAAYIRKGEARIAAEKAHYARWRYIIEAWNWWNRPADDISYENKVSWFARFLIDFVLIAGFVLAFFYTMFSLLQ